IAATRPIVWLLMAVAEPSPALDNSNAFGDAESSTSVVLGRPRALRWRARARPTRALGSLEKQHHADGERERQQLHNPFSGRRVDSLSHHCRPLRVRRIYCTARRHKGSAGCGIVTGGGFMLYWRTS